MAQKTINEAKGLHTFKNELTLPDGALVKADNVVIDRDNVIEPRRGFKLYNSFGSDGDTTKQILQYKDRLLVHYSNKLAFESINGTFTDFNGDYNELESGLRIKGIETSGNFYFTTSNGIKKISAINSSQFTTSGNYIIEAGAAKALDLSGKCNYESEGFLTADSVCAYRIVWGYKDVNQNLILGYPSPIAIVRNIDANNSCTVDLKFTIPQEVQTNGFYFYQVYRSGLKTPASLIPEDEMNLVFEDFPTSTDLTNGYVSTNDLTPEDFRVNGALLYTNVISGDGISQANEKPPVAKDIEYFKGSTFYANTQTRHKLIISLLSVDNFTSGSTKILIGNNNAVNEYTFRGLPEKSYIDWSGYTGSIPSALAGLYSFINSASDERQYYIWFDTTGTDTAPQDNELLGKIGIKVDVSSATTKANIALSVTTELNNLDDFIAKVNGSIYSSAEIIEIENSKNGNTTDLSDSSNNPIDNGIAFGVDQQGLGEDSSSNIVLLSSSVSVGQRIDETARSLINIINSDVNGIVYAYYLSSVNDVPGQIVLESRNLEDDVFYIATNDSNVINKFNPALPVVQSGVSVESSNPAVGTARFTLASHGFSIDNSIVVYNSSGITPAINGTHIITNVSTNTFDVSFASVGNGTVDLFIGTVASDNEIKPNRVYFSKDGEPESVPSVNYFDVGAKDDAILRVIALRDSLFFLKTDGVYRLSGTDIANYTVTLFDESSPLIAPDSAAVLNNQIYMLSTQGVVSITDSGISVVSRNIEDLILKPTSNNYANFASQSFGFASETDRAYFLFLPENVEDTTATQGFRYNVFTRTWTRWVMSKTAGIVKRADDKIYFGTTDTNYIEQERKNFNRTDYADRQYNNTISILGGTDIYQLSTLSNVKVNDVLYQQQYITVRRFNRLLIKLDSDPNLTFGAYEATYKVSAGSDLGTQLSMLITQIDADDTSQSYTPYSPNNDLETLRDGYNTLISELNASSQVFYSNYREYTDLVEYESAIKEINNILTQVTVLTSVPFIIGDVITFKAVGASFEYAPQAFGEASLMKQIREATLMFDQYNFTIGLIEFRTDLSASLEGNSVVAEGHGAYGTQIYGSKVYGGLGNEVPHRTYIPRNKVRCRFIRMSFQHLRAREKFAITGHSYTFNENPTVRAYRR